MFQRVQFGKLQRERPGPGLAFSVKPWVFHSVDGKKDERFDGDKDPFEILAVLGFDGWELGGIENGTFYLQRREG